jgi:branched-chain amino acid transport system substrate-binding protein
MSSCPQRSARFLTRVPLLFLTLIMAWVGLLPRSSDATEPIRIALIEPLSGPFSNVAQVGFRQFQAEVDVINARGGVLGRRIEVTGFDNKSSAQEATIQLQAAIDQGIRFVTQGSGSNVAHALNDAIAKHNARNPDRTVLFLNTGSLDPALTNDKCQFWLFRFVPHGQLMLSAFSEALTRDKSVKRVYLMNQDYAWGQSVSRSARELLAARRPDIEIVGDELHPMGKVKDFAPYVTKIASSKADAVITGNWGNDLSLLVRAAKDAGLRVDFYALLAGLTGTPAAIGEAGDEAVRAVHFWHVNLGDSPYRDRALAFRTRFKEDCCWLPNHLVPAMLAMAIERAQATDPMKVALALEGLRYTGPTGEVWIRPEDHQVMMPLYGTVFAKAGSTGVKYDAEGTGYGWKTDVRVEVKDHVPPVTCRVQRP